MSLKHLTPLQERIYVAVVGRGLSTAEAAKRIGCLEYVINQQLPIAIERAKWRDWPAPDPDQLNLFT